VLHKFESQSATIVSRKYQ